MKFKVKKEELEKIFTKDLLKIPVAVDFIELEGESVEKICGSRCFMCYSEKPKKIERVDFSTGKHDNNNVEDKLNEIIDKLND